MTRALSTATICLIVLVCSAGDVAALTYPKLQTCWEAFQSAQADSQSADLSSDHTKNRFYSLCIRAARNTSSTDYITLLGVIVTGTAILIQQRRSVRVQKTEIYVRLELASSELFSFEAENVGHLERYRDLFMHENKFDDHEKIVMKIYDKLENGYKCSNPKVMDAYRTIELEKRMVRKYYEKTLNLFEIAARLKASRIIEPQVFGSWVIWYYDTLCEFAFRNDWDDLRLNYTPDLRAVFDKHISHFKHDVPDEIRRHEFFQDMADLYSCSILKHWLNDSMSSLLLAQHYAVEQPKHIRHFLGRY